MRQNLTGERLDPEQSSKVVLLGGIGDCRLFLRRGVRFGRPLTRLVCVGHYPDSTGGVVDVEEAQAVRPGLLQLLRDQLLRFQVAQTAPKCVWTSPARRDRIDLSP
jgi:hypothetical protein